MGRGKQRIDFASVAAMVDLPAVLASEGINLRNGKGMCPFHQNFHTEALSVYHRDGRWWFRCHGCDTKGDALNWFMLREGLSAVDAAKRVDPTLGTPSKTSKSGTAQPPLVPAPLAESKPALPEWQENVGWQLVVDGLIALAKQILWSDQGREALDWLRFRGLKDETIRTFQLGFLPAEGWSQKIQWNDGRVFGIHYERGVMFPWLAPRSSGTPSQMKWCGANVRRLMPNPFDRFPSDDDKCKALKGSQRGHFFPQPAFPESETMRAALIVEGEIDALLAVQEVSDLVHVGTVGGATQGPQESALTALAYCPYWLIATDRDEAGIKGAWEWDERSPRKARRLILTAGCNDIGEFVQGGGNLREWLIGEMNRLGLGLKVIPTPETIHPSPPEMTQESEPVSESTTDTSPHDDTGIDLDSEVASVRSWRWLVANLPHSQWKTWRKRTAELEPPSATADQIKAAEFLAFSELSQYHERKSA